MLSLHSRTSQAVMGEFDRLVKNSVDRQYALQPELWQPTQAVYTKSIRDTGYHFSYLAEALAMNDTSAFLDYVAWVKVLFAGLGFSPGVLAASLDCMSQALRQILPPEMAVLACGYIESALEHLPGMASTSESFLSPALPLSELAANYLDALLSGDRHLASHIILDAVTRGVDVRDIYLHVFQPCQHEMGRLWQMNQVSVAREHFSTNVTQMIMSQLYPHIFTAPKNGRQLVATSVGGELHEIGARMVVDFLEMEGWDTYYLGANTPAESVLRTLAERNPDVLAISATLTVHVSKVTELISQIRSTPGCASVKILVGGYPFNIVANLWQHVGADGYAPNAREAVLAANALLEQSG
jgi:methanogenic corrinoid protein MtbC1